MSTELEPVKHGHLTLVSGNSLTVTADEASRVATALRYQNGEGVVDVLLTTGSKRTYNLRNVETVLVPELP